MTAYRAILMTSNNPHLYYDWAKGFDYAKASPADFKRLLEASIQPFIKGANGVDRNPSKNGVMAVAELGSSFHFHHLFFSQSSPIKMNSLRRRYPHSNTEPVRGTAQEVIDYLNKQGKYEGKSDTQLCEPVVWGSYFADNKGTGDNSGGVFAEIDELLSQGLQPREIYKISPKFAFYRAAIETSYSARKARDIPLRRELTVYWHFGESGSGKSHTYYDLCEQHSSDDVYFVSGEYRNIWDMYNFEKIAFLDEFRAHSMPYAELLGLLDHLPYTLRCRYSDRIAAFTEIHITSPYPPEKLYPNMQGFDSVKQLLRRLSFVSYHYINNSLPADEMYQTITVPATEYTGYKALQEQANEKNLKSLSLF